MTVSTSRSTSSGMPSTNDALTLFEDIAITTWEWLGQARQLGLSFSEETVTDIAALRIAREAPSQIRIAKATRQDERRYGIDWMWFIGNPGQGYRRYAVQAKKITLDSSANFSYRLRHRVSRIPGSEFQIERLEQFARKARAIPLYCFYNNVDPALASRKWHCLVHRKQPDDLRQMGCTIVPLDAVQVVHRPHHRKHFSAVHHDARSIPWRCLFHSNCLVACVHGRPDYRKGLMAGQHLRDNPTSLPRGQSLPEFLLGDSQVIESSDVIRELELEGLLGDHDPDAMLTSRIQPAIPAWFIVIEAE